MLTATFYRRFPKKLSLFNFICGSLCRLPFVTYQCFQIVLIFLSVTLIFKVVICKRLFDSFVLIYILVLYISIEFPQTNTKGITTANWNKGEFIEELTIFQNIVSKPSATRLNSSN